MKKQMFLIDVKNDDISVVQADGLEDYYKLIDCRCIDIVSRRIGDKVYDIICDDEGLYSENPRVSAVDSALEPMLVGNLLIAGLADEEGHLTSLARADIKHIITRVHTAKTKDCPEGYPILTDCNY